MSERPSPEVAALVATFVESFARAGRSYLRVEDASGETLFESKSKRDAEAPLRSVVIDVEGGPTLRLEGELDEDRLAAVGGLLQQTLGLHQELDETRTHLGRTREELALLFELSQTLKRITSVEEVVERFLADVVNVLDAREGTFLAVDEEKRELRILCHHGSTPRTVAEFRLAIGEGVAGKVAQDGQARIINDTQKCDYYIDDINPVRSLIAVPMHVGGRLIGVVSINDRQAGEPFTLGHLHLLSSLARLGEIGLENARLYEEVRGLLFDSVDALVGLMDARDAHTVGHSRRVARLAYSTGRQMRLKVLDLERLYLAALVHDIGKMALPPELLSREGALTEFEKEEVRKHPDGCGDPSQYVRPGETVLDLGSGAGKICYITAQVVGSEGHVIGVDMNDAMLELANTHRQAIGERLGYHNVTFHKGKIQDLRPMIADDSVDVVVSNCVLNLVKKEDREQLFRELFRVIRHGGRAVISDIVSEREVPDALQNDPELWSGCISGAYREDRFLEAFEEVGFLGGRIVKRDVEPWRVVDGMEFRSVTVEAYKGEIGATRGTDGGGCCGSG